MVNNTSIVQRSKSFLVYLTAQVYFFIFVMDVLPYVRLSDHASSSSIDHTGVWYWISQQVSVLGFSSSWLSLSLLARSPSRPLFLSLFKRSQGRPLVSAFDFVTCPIAVSGSFLLFHTKSKSSAHFRSRLPILCPVFTAAVSETCSNSKRADRAGGGRDRGSPDGVEDAPSVP